VFFFKESSCISFANMVFGNSSVYLAFTITMVVWSGGPLTPRKYKPISFVRCNAAEAFLVLREQRFLMGRAVRSPSTCLKPPQYFKEGRLNQFFANNVDIPVARARRLRPCPRKATVRSGKQPNAYVAAVYINYKD